MTLQPLPAKPPDIGALLRSLVEAGVDFVLIGGQAGIAHGSSYPSFDVDVAYGRGHANALSLVVCLDKLDVRLRGAPADLPFQLDARAIENGANFTFTTRFGDLDVLADIAGIRDYDDLSKAAEVKEIGGVRVRIASIDHLIAMKRAANRPKDRLMLEEYIVIAEEQRRLEEESG